MSTNTNDNFIEVLKTLYFRGEYSEDLEKIILYIEESFLNNSVVDYNSLHVSKKIKSELVSLYLDYIDYSTNDSIFSNEEKANISFIKHFFKNDSEDLHKYHQERVVNLLKKIGAINSRYSAIDSNIVDFCFYLKWALDISEDEFLKISEEFAIPIELKTGVENVFIKHDRISNRPEKYYPDNNDFKQEKNSQNLLKHENTESSISKNKIDIEPFTIILSVIGLTISILGAYMIYDFIGIFFSKIIQWIGAIISFLWIFSLFAKKCGLSFSPQQINYNNRHISTSVRREVWRRDQGKCVECNSQFNLEYDHIIPFSEGGSNTARNIRLLCQHCNRKKSNSI